MELTERQKNTLQKINTDAERALIISSRLKRLERVLKMEFDSELVHHAFSGAISLLNEEDCLEIALLIQKKLIETEHSHQIEMATIVSELGVDKNVEQIT